MFATTCSVYSVLEAVAMMCYINLCSMLHYITYILTRSPNREKQSRAKSSKYSISFSLIQPPMSCSDCGKSQ